jgi:NhaA family Na+:H+ antiporter
MASESFRRSWVRSGRPVPRRVVRPIERFLKLEAGSASLLLIGALAALVWANVAAGSYERFWSMTLSVDLGPLQLTGELRGVVNDFLMAVFFYVVALEIKRERVFGTLRDRRSAGVPVAAALGTMVGAGLVYLAVNLGGGDMRGWAIPIATDIAFAVGVLGLAGTRVPGELRIFLLTVAVVDDLGTIIIIAIFFSVGISVVWLGAAAAAALAITLLNRVAVRFLVPYVALGALMWLSVLESGVHATIAGVVLGFLTPAIAFHPRQPTGDAISIRLAELSRANDEISESVMWETSRLAREAVSPLTRIEEQLHPWSAYAILPTFALANAGVALSVERLTEALSGRVGLGIFLGLVFGAPLGGLLFAWLVVRTGLAPLPEGLDWSALGSVAPLKGIGFTVAIFMSVLAFDDETLREQAKVAILAASTVAAAIGLTALYARHLLRRRRAAAG